MGKQSLADERAGHWRVPTLYSQRDLDSIGGDWGGGVWDPAEIASGEWRRLKYIIVHGAHFFLEWRATRDRVRSHCPKYHPLARNLCGLFRMEGEATCSPSLTPHPPLWEPSPMAHKGHTPSCLWTFQGSRTQSRPRLLLPAPRPPQPLPRESTPHACLTKKGGVEGVCAVHRILLQEAGVGKAALDIPAPLPSGIQH